MPVVYSAEVEKAIAEVCPPRDAFDASDFDPVEYLNSRFPDEASLAALPAFLDETSNRLRQTENELLKAVEVQASAGASTAEKDLKSAKDAVGELYKRVSDIKAKATESEATVQELCQHIRELDTAKTNLTASINTLRSVQLWMLQLQTLSTSFERKKFAQCRDALQEAKKYAAIFAKMTDVPKVKELNDKQGQLCRQVEYYIRNTIFGDLSLDSLDENMMAEACAIIDLMDQDSIKRIRDRFIDKALETYTLRFRRGTDDAKLERTERRYVYIRGVLEHYDSLFRNVFPRHWCVPQELCVTFCLRTKQELDYQLQEAAGSIDVVVLMYVLQKTIDIERDLTHMMAWKEEFPGRHELPVYRYNGLILSAFKAHMYLFVENEDKLMGDALAQSPIEHGVGAAGGTACIGWNGEDDVRVGTALPMAEDIFVFIKESLKRSLRIAQQDVLLDMARVWRKHLLRFANLVLTVLPSPAVTALEVRRACIVVNTADLCQSTSQDLGDEVGARSEASTKDVGFDEVVEAFSGLYSRAIQALVAGVERTLGPTMAEYASGGFLAGREASAGAGNASAAAVGVSSLVQDESRLVRGMTTVLHDLVLYCTAVLPNATLRFLLDKVAASVIPAYANTLYRQRRLSDDAVSILRVDAVALEKTFLQLPNYNDPNRFPATVLAGYMKLVRREFDQMHRALKVLQVDARGEAFMDVYYEVIQPEDRSIQNFVRLVELKGLKREEVRPWIARLSKRGVVEATRRDVAREAALGLTTGGLLTSGTGALTGGTTNSSSNNTAMAHGAGASGANTSGGLNFAALFSRDSNFKIGSTAATTTGTTTAAAAAAPAASPSTTNNGGGGGGGFSFSTLVSNLAAGAPSATQPASTTQNTTTTTTTATATAASPTTDEETLGARFANAARTATSINFFNKFKKNEGK